MKGGGGSQTHGKLGIGASPMSIQKCPKQE